MNESEFRKRQDPLPLDPPPALPEAEEIPFAPDAGEPLVPEAWLPAAVGPIVNHQTALPRIAKDARLIAQIERRLPQIPTEHHLFNADARDLDFIPPDSVHLVLTSPPYWTLKTYRENREVSARSRGGTAVAGVA